MRLTHFSLVFLLACGGDDDPHVTGACQGWVDNQGNPFTGMCEAACAKPPVSTGRTCNVFVRDNCPSFEFSGAEGCCIEDGAVIRFYECL